MNSLCIVDSPIVVEMELSQFNCPKQTQIVVEATSSIGALILLVAIILMLIYIKQDELKILIFAKLSIRWKEQKEIKSAAYDAYILYSDKDCHWAHEVLLIGLRNQGFSTFDKNRDSQPGYVLEEQLDKAFQTSHRVIVVLSKNLLTDDEALSQFYRADAHGKLRDRKRYIIMIKLGDSANDPLCDQVELYNTFARYLTTDYYVDVRNPQFWRRLFYWMPRPSLPVLPSSTMSIDRNSNEQDLNSDSTMVNEITPLLCN